MKCPNCSAESPDDSSECPSCSLVFAKWRAAAERPPLIRRSGESRPITWIALSVLIAAAAAYRYFSGSISLSEAADVGIAGGAVEKTASLHQDESGRFIVPSDHCGYEGRVMDLALNVPIPGALIYLDAYKASTDASGRYQMAVRAISGKCEPFPSARHPDYQGNYWTRLFPDAEPEQRYALRNDSPAIDLAEGSAGAATTLDFSLFPKKVPESLLAKIAENSSQ